jgi:hypothetical protein
MRGPKESVLHATASVAMIAASIYLLVAAHQVRTRHATLTVLEPYEVGDELTDVAALRPLATERLLLMWIQSTCPYCGKSMPLYRRLAGDRQLAARLVAMGPESEEVIRAYLKENHVDVQDVFTGPQDVRLYGTPTLLVLEPGLKVSSVWAGALDADEEVRLAVAIGRRPSPLR